VTTMKYQEVTSDLAVVDMVFTFPVPQGLCSGIGAPGAEDVRCWILVVCNCSD
jgi:hypothetical protein